jgi:hypothetical protein
MSAKSRNGAKMMSGTDQPRVELGSKLNSGLRPVEALEAVDADDAANHTAAPSWLRLSAGPPGR